MRGVFANKCSATFIVLLRCFYVGNTAQHTVQHCTVYDTLSHFNSIISVNVCMQPIDFKPVIKSMLWLRLYSMPFHGNFLTQRELYYCSPLLFTLFIFILLDSPEREWMKQNRSNPKNGRKRDGQTITLSTKFKCRNRWQCNHNKLM